jgi:hypothetical protein
MARITQADDILAYMKEHGSITQMEAYTLGCTRLPSRIFDLKQAGYNIGYEWAKVANRRGGHSTIKKYKLMEANNGLV